MNKYKKQSQKPDDGATMVALSHLKEEDNVQCLCAGSSWDLRLTRVIANICEHWAGPGLGAQTHSTTVNLYNIKVSLSPFYRSQNWILEKSRPLLGYNASWVIIQIKVPTIVFAVVKCPLKITKQKLKRKRRQMYFKWHDCIFLLSSLLYPFMQQTTTKKVVMKDEEEEGMRPLLLLFVVDAWGFSDSANQFQGSWSHISWKKECARWDPEVEGFLKPFLSAVVYLRILFLHVWVPRPWQMVFTEYYRRFLSLSKILVPNLYLTF